jgi:hypothetical protein
VSEFRSEMQPLAVDAALKWASDRRECGVDIPSDLNWIKGEKPLGFFEKDLAISPPLDRDAWTVAFRCDFLSIAIEPQRS